MAKSGRKCDEHGELGDQRRKLIRSFLDIENYRESRRTEVTLELPATYVYLFLPEGGQRLVFEKNKLFKKKNLLGKF